MELIEIERALRLRRKGAAAWLHSLADSLARHHEVEFVSRANRCRVGVPDELTLSAEIEISVDNEIEVEISW